MVIRSPVRAAVRASVRSSVRGGGAPSLLTQASAIVLAASGALYDPSDLTSLYQSRTGGSTGASGSVVGIMLDKSHMGGQTAAAYIAGQAELVTNGGFATNDLTGWTNASTGTGSVSAATGAAVLTGVDPSNIADLRQAITTVAGQWYMVVQERSNTNAFFRVGSTNGGAELLAASNTHPTTVFFRATGTTAYLRWSIGSAASSTIDNVSIKEIPGFHAVAPSDAARPVLTVAGGLAYLTADGFDDWMNVLPALALGSAYWHVGGWMSASSARRGFAAGSGGDHRGSLVFSHGGGGGHRWYANDGVTQSSITTADVTAAHVVTVERASNSAIAGRFNGAAGSSIDPFDLTATDIALFSDRVGSWLNGLAGRFYGGAFAPGALTAGDRAILEQLMAEKSGVTLA